MKKKNLKLAKLSLGKDIVSKIGDEATQIKGGTFVTGCNCPSRRGQTCDGATNCPIFTGQTGCHEDSYGCPISAFTCESVQVCSA